MFKFLKTQKLSEEGKPQESPQEVTSKQSWFKRLGQGLARTRNQLGAGVARIVLGKKVIDDELFEELETVLLTADVGIETSQKILNKLTEQVKRKELTNPQMLLTTLKRQLTELLKTCDKPLEINGKPFTILMVGVNGSGKTTSIAKLAYLFKQEGKRVLLAAGDTFRAAAIDQLQAWGDRNDTPVIAQQPGADSASVIYDAMQAAQARGYDLLIADTAGRLHTQEHLMMELQKIKRVMCKLDASAPQETLLVLDASMGQNALNQAQQFHQAIGLTGIALTKLDGTAKGGIIFSIVNQMNLPIRFIGVGEKIDDLKPFNAEEFVEALFGENH